MSVLETPLDAYARQTAPGMAVHGRGAWQAAAGSARWRGEQDLIPRAAQAMQSKPIEPEDALHMCKPHLESSCAPDVTAGRPPYLASART